MTNKVLIFRRGSLGDGVVSLPALAALAERFQGCERRLLTNTPVAGKAPPLQALLEGSGLIDDCFVFPPTGRRPSGIRKLRSEIRAWGPDTLVYLSEPSSRLRLVREAVFFRWCGIGRFVGFPFGDDLRTYRKADGELWESESRRLLRAIGAGPGDDAAADILAFRPDEATEADKALSGWPGAERFIVFSIGGKGRDKDWGDANWRAVLESLGAGYPDLGIAGLGSGDERQRSDALFESWPGPSLNLCGELGPRLGALIARRALIYLGHDSGPMHLAALAGLPCVAVFSARAKPGVWFPAGHRHRIFYPWRLTARVPAAAGFRPGGESILSIEPGTVAAGCRELLAD